MSMDLSAFFDVFYEEAEELLAEMEKLLLGLDLGAPSNEDLNGIFRAAHSIKGGSATFGMGEISELTHVLESLLDLLRKGALEQSERVLHVMDDIYYLLISMDFPDAITRGLRRSTDLARGCLEKTRGDLTTHWAGVNLERELSGLRRGLSMEADQLLEAALRR